MQLDLMPRGAVLCVFVFLQGEKDASLRPNVWTYNTVLAGLIRGERMDSALAVWADLKARQESATDSVRADVVTINTLLDGLLRQDPPRLREAEGLFVEMMEGGTMPDQYTFSILLHAYAPSDSAQEASLMTGPHRLLDLMMRNRDLNLDTTAVNTLLLALSRGRDFKRAIALFDDFKAGACAFDRTVSTVYIASLGRYVWDVV